jgi:hypothetical protein
MTTTTPIPNPFQALGLPADPNLSDEQVRAAWRAIAAATHPDRADGGDLARYTRATAAYAELRSPWGRTEAYADVQDQAWRDGHDDDDDGGGGGDGPGTEPLPAIPAAQSPPVLPWQPLITMSQVPARIARGRPRRLLIRAVIAAALALAVLQLIPGTAAAPADITGVLLWLVLTGRKDLAPRPER